MEAIERALTSFALGGRDIDDIPAMVRPFMDRAEAEVLARLNAAANDISDSHNGENSYTIRQDDRANLFVSVAGWMLRHPVSAIATSLNDSAIVDAAIADSYSADHVFGEDEGELIETVRGWSE